MVKISHTGLDSKPAVTLNHALNPSDIRNMTVKFWLMYCVITDIDNDNNYHTFMQKHVTDANTYRNLDAMTALQSTAQ